MSVHRNYLISRQMGLFERTTESVSLARLGSTKGERVKVLVRLFYCSHSFMTLPTLKSNGLRYFEIIMPRQLAVHFFSLYYMIIITCNLEKIQISFTVITVFPKDFFPTCFEFLSMLFKK